MFLCLFESFIVRTTTTRSIPTSKWPFHTNIMQFQWQIRDPIVCWVTRKKQLLHSRTKIENHFLRLFSSLISYQILYPVLKNKWYIHQLEKNLKVWILTFQNAWRKWKINFLVFLSHTVQKSGLGTSYTFRTPWTTLIWWRN